MPKPEIIVHDLATVEIDGQHAGAVTDVLANHGKTPGIPSALLEAIGAWQAAIHAGHRDELKARDDRHAEAVKAADARLAEEAAAHEARVAEMAEGHRAEIERHEASRRLERARYAETIKGHRRVRDRLRQRYAAVGGDEAWRATRGEWRLAKQNQVERLLAELAEIDEDERNEPEGQA